MHRSNFFAAIALASVAALHVSTIPQTFWEYDEHLFAMGVERFEPLRHHPPPPGAPLYIAFAKVVAVFTGGDVFLALIATSLLALVAGLIAFTGAFRAISRSNATGVLATVLLYASPAVLMSGTLPQSDSGALALFGYAIWACSRGNPLAAGIACAAAIGWRPQFSIAVAPMFVTSLVLMRTWRDRTLAVGVFGLACLAWMFPTAIATGGPLSYWKWLSGQAAYYAAHDAHLSRSGYTAPQLALRFIAHPWGPKWLAIPVLVLGIAGLLRFVAIANGGAGLLGSAQVRRSRTSRREIGGPISEEESRRSREAGVIPLAVGCLVYVIFAALTMDPADAVRYAIPSLPLIALLAATLWRVAIVLVPLYAIGSYWYASPILRSRATSISPPTAAIRWIEANVPRDAIIMYDAPLRPHVENLLRGWRTMRSDAPLGAAAPTPVVVLADSELGDAKGAMFRWPDTDAYRKLTRQHYGAVSVVPLPPEQRFRVIDGVFAPERTRDGKTWRWISARGTIELPDLGATDARLVFRAPPEYPFDANVVHVNGSKVIVRRNSTATLVVSLSRGRRLTLIPERSFVPATIAGANNRDRRTLSVMLTGVEQERRPPRTR